MSHIVRSEKSGLLAKTCPSSAPIIVAGMHRSGTSLLARLLGDLGVHMGNELDIHHEAELMKEINNHLLSMAGSHWANPEGFTKALADDDFASHCHSEAVELLCQGWKRYGDPVGYWGWKDPRNTVTLPVWMSCFPDSKIIRIVRNGFDVAMSVYRREVRRWISVSTEKRMFPPTLGASFRLWEIYLKTGSRHEASYPRQHFCIRYEDLLKDPVNSLSGISSFIGFKSDVSLVSGIASRIVKSPAARSKVGYLWLRLLMNVGQLRTDSMKLAGYDP